MRLDHSATTSVSAPARSSSAPEAHRVLPLQPRLAALERADLLRPHDGREPAAAHGAVHGREVSPALAPPPYAGGGVRSGTGRCWRHHRSRARSRRFSAHSGLHVRAMTEGGLRPRRARGRSAASHEHRHSEQRHRTLMRRHRGSSAALLPSLRLRSQSRSSHRSFACAAARVCHCMFWGASRPQQASGTT
jgi:hypothetical protein